MKTDIVDAVNKLKEYVQQFLLSPERWSTLDIPVYEWQSIHFAEGNAVSIPKTRGIYCFVVKCNSELVPSHGYIMYVGITGNENKRTLRDRYREYVREMVRAKRYNIHYMLNMWENHLYFNFIEVHDTSVDLSKIERNLISALFPPYNTTDFLGDLRKIGEAAW